MSADTTPDRSYVVPMSVSAVRAMEGTQPTVAVQSGGVDELRFWSGNYGVLIQRPTLVLTYLPTSVP